MAEKQNKQHSCGVNDFIDKMVLCHLGFQFHSSKMSWSHHNIWNNNNSNSKDNDEKDNNTQHNNISIQQTQHGRKTVQKLCCQHPRKENVAQKKTISNGDDQFEIKK